MQPAAATPSFALTFDTELIWGSFDHTSPRAFARRYPDIRGTIHAIIRLLETYEVPATWAIVGHLFLGECERGPDGRPHPELVHPGQSWFTGDWLAADPCSNRATNPLWYGDDIVEAVMEASTPQEIGSHSFSHALFADPAMTDEAVRSDLARSIELARQRGITLRSFVFPRNREGHYEALRAAGFTAYRGADPTWHSPIGGQAGRAAHLADQLFATAPPVNQPSEPLPGLWNIPGSMVLLPRTGPRRLIPMMSRVRKASIGLRRAARSGGVFHLWAHPFSLSNDRRAMLGGLEAILRDASRHRERGSMHIETMAAVANRMAASKAAPPDQ